MLKISGTHIEKLPFDGLTEINELMAFQDSPVLIHLHDNNKNDIISYWVDFDNNGHRWLYARISKRELFDFLLAGRSLKDLLLNLNSDFYFFVDFDLHDNIVDCRMLQSGELPKEYLPKGENYYLNSLPDFYSDYLKEFEYITNLRTKSYAIKVTPNDLTYGRTVGAKEAAKALIAFTNSIEGYVKVTAFNIMKNDFGDLNKLNRRIAKLADRFSPRVTEVEYNSFEFWIAMDVVSFSGEDKFDTELRKVLVDGYRNDVLDVDYSNEIDAVVIREKYTHDERKLIYEPIIRVIENKNISVCIGENVSRNKKSILVNEKFKDIILPKPTLDEVQAEINKKNTLRQIVVNLKEGDDLTRFTKKELLDHIVFEGGVAQSPYTIESPIISNGVEVRLSRPLNLIMEISENGNLLIYNTELDLFYESHDLHEIVTNLKAQFVQLYNKYMMDTENAKYADLKKYLI